MTTQVGTGRSMFDVVSVRHESIGHLATVVMALRAPTVSSRLQALPTLRPAWNAMRSGNPSGTVVLDGWAVDEIDYAVALLSAADLTASRDQGPQPVVSALHAVLQGYANLGGPSGDDVAELSVAKKRAMLRELLRMDPAARARGHLELTHAIIVGSQTDGRPRQRVRLAGSAAVAVQQLLSHVGEDPLARPPQWTPTELLPHAAALLSDYGRLLREPSTPPANRPPCPLLARCSPNAVDDARTGTFRLNRQDLESLQKAVHYLGTAVDPSGEAPRVAVAVAEAARGLLASAWTGRAGTTDTTPARQLLEMTRHQAATRPSSGGDAARAGR